MRAAYESFRTGSPPDGILAAAAPAMQTGGHDAFYSQLVGVRRGRGAEEGSMGGVLRAAVCRGEAFLSGGKDLPRKAREIWTRW